MVAESVTFPGRQEAAGKTFSPFKGGETDRDGHGIEDPFW